MGDFFTIGKFITLLLAAFIVIDGYKAGQYIEQKNYAKAGLNISFIIVISIILLSGLVSMDVNIIN